MTDRHGSGRVSVATAILTLAAVTGTLVLLSCDADHQAITDKSRTTRLVPDSPEVRSLIADAQRLNRDKKNDVESPEQDAFVDAMTSRQTIEVPPGSYLRILQWSTAVCAKVRYNSVFIKVQVTTGDAKGEIGWGCMLDITLTNPLP